jgi:hypothetical protein
MRAAHFSDTDFQIAIYAFQNPSPFARQYIEGKKLRVHARREGPVTSKMAAAALNEKGHNMTKLRLFLRHLALAAGPRTLWQYDLLRRDERFLEFMESPKPYSRSTIRRRVSELVAVGLLEVMNQLGESELGGKPAQLVKALTDEEIEFRLSATMVQGELAL